MGFTTFLVFVATCSPDQGFIFCKLHGKLPGYIISSGQVIKGGWGGRVLFESFANAAFVDLLGLESFPPSKLDSTRPVLFVWSTTELVRKLQLIDLTATWKDGFLCQQLRQDASDRPHIDCRAVIDGTQQQLGGSVPQRDNAVGVIARLFVEGTRESKVCQLQLSLVVDQQVGA